MRRIFGALLAAQLAVGALLPLCARAEPGAAMACCMMDGACACAHDDASFSRCQEAGALVPAAAQPAWIAAPVGTASPTAPRRLVPEGRDPAAGLYRFAPPTPPPRIAAV